MDACSFTLEYYITETGKIPFRDWLESLKDIHARAKIRVALDRIRLGYFGHAKSVGEGVHEFKIDYGPGYRVYYAFSGAAIVLLLLGGDKASQSK
ncbi:MAG: type II toxin-antitoxin system RelE/ParE family toxin, partial [Thermodesulfovibrionales bacterium]|nr:type II toxin-antitoxin system RelE/ParE family toxin [Thermodesulfovibrionales bacterium]